MPKRKSTRAAAPPTISQKTLAEFLRAQAVEKVRIAQQPNGCYRIEAELARCAGFSVLALARTGEPRSFRGLDAPVRLLREELGVHPHDIAFSWHS